MAVTLLGTVIASDNVWGQNIQLYERTTDPSSPSVGDWWYRSDTDEFKAVTNSSGTIAIPGLPPGDLNPGVEGHLRAQTSNGDRVVPLAATADAAYPMFQVVTPDGTSLGVHDAASLVTATVFEDFERASPLDEYTGTLADFTTSTTSPIEGTTMLEGNSTGTSRIFSTSGLAGYPQQDGIAFEATVRLDVDDTGVAIGFGTQDASNYYEIQLLGATTDLFRIVKETGGSFSAITSDDFNPSAGTDYTLRVDTWDSGTTNIVAYLRENGKTVRWISASDTDHSSGGLHWTHTIGGSTVFADNYTEVDTHTESFSDWSPLTSNPVLTNSGTGFESNLIEAGCPVTFDDSTLYLFYHGRDPIRRIGWASGSSPSTLTKSSDNPVFTPGTSGEWDDSGVGDPYVTSFPDGNDTYQLWYAGHSQDTGIGNTQVGLAESSDLVNWTRNANNPILPPSGSGWDSGETEACAVTQFDGFSGKYQMFYGGNDGSYPFQIGLAYSDDLVNWTKESNNPVFTEDSTGWDSGLVNIGDVIEQSGTYYMFYSGYDTNIENPAIGLATSTDLVNWNRYEHNPILVGDAANGFEGAVRSIYENFSGTEYLSFHHSGSNDNLALASKN